MQPPVEIRYAGVPVARAESVRRPEPSKARVFLVTSEPLPVGTEIELFTDTEILSARVTKVTESADPEKTGMHVLLIGVPDEPEPPPPEPPAVVEAAPAAAEPSAEPPPSDTDGVPEAVGGDGASGSIEVSEAIEPSGAHVTGESNGTNGAPANGAGKRKRRRRR